MICKICKDVVADIDSLGNGEVIPMCGNELGERIRSDKTRVLRLRVVQYVLALRNVVRRRLKGEESGLGFIPGDGLTVFAGGRRPRVEGFAQGFHLC